MRPGETSEYGELRRWYLLRVLWFMRFWILLCRLWSTTGSTLLETMLYRVFQSPAQ